MDSPVDILVRRAVPRLDFKAVGDGLRAAADVADGEAIRCRHRPSPKEHRLPDLSSNQDGMSVAHSPRTTTTRRARGGHRPCGLSPREWLESVQLQLFNLTKHCVCIPPIHLLNLTICTLSRFVVRVRSDPGGYWMIEPDWFD